MTSKNNGIFLRYILTGGKKRPVILLSIVYHLHSITYAVK